MQYVSKMHGRTSKQGKPSYIRMNGDEWFKDLIERSYLATNILNM